VPASSTTRSSRRGGRRDRRRAEAPLACKTDKIDSHVLALLSHRDLVPAIWLLDPRIREERELARFRLHLVKHRSALKNRVHSTLINFGKHHPCALYGRRPLPPLACRSLWGQPWRAPGGRDS
jgi:hypothetical protein